MVTFLIVDSCKERVDIYRSVIAQLLKASHTIHNAITCKEARELFSEYKDEINIMIFAGHIYDPVEHGPGRDRSKRSEIFTNWSLIGELRKQFLGPMIAADEPTAHMIEAGCDHGVYIPFSCVQGICQSYSPSWRNASQEYIEDAMFRKLHKLLSRY